MYLDVWCLECQKKTDYIMSPKIVYNKDYIKHNYANISEKELKEVIWQDIKKINNKL